jgi:hypothetical protein
MGTKIVNESEYAYMIEERAVYTWARETYTGKTMSGIRNGFHPRFRLDSPTKVTVQSWERLSILRRDPVCTYARCAAGPNIE